MVSPDADCFETCASRLCVIHCRCDLRTSGQRCRQVHFSSSVCLYCVLHIPIPLIDVLTRIDNRYRRLLCAFIPMTINYVYLRCSPKLTGASVHKLSICLRALEALAEHHPVVDYFHSLLDASLNFLQTQHFSLIGTASIVDSSELSHRECEGQPGGVLLPPTTIYSAVLNFQEKIYWTLGTPATSTVGYANSICTSRGITV